MSHRDQPSPLDLALQGDEEALERVLGGVVAPLFDFALHLRRQPVAAELAVVEALQHLAAALRSGRLPIADPLAVAARHLRERSRQAPPEPRPPAAGPLAAAIESLDDPDREALLAALALDAEGEDLGYILGSPTGDAQARVQAALARLPFSEGEIREGLDGAASEVPLPRGLVDRAV